MRRKCVFWIGVLSIGSAMAWGPRTLGQTLGQQALGQDRVKVEVTVPAVPNIGTVTASQAPSELSTAPRGIIYIGSRGAYRIAGGGHEGQSMFRDSDNRFWANSLTYYGMSNGYWIASVNGAPDTFLAFQATPTSPEAPYFKVLIHTPGTSGYVVWDEATRGNAQ